MTSPQLGAVDQIVVHERGRVHELDGDGCAQQPLLALAGMRRPARRLGGQHDKQRAQPLAAGDDRGVRQRGQRRAGLRCHLLQMELRASHALAQLVARRAA